MPPSTSIESSARRRCTWARHSQVLPMPPCTWMAVSHTDRAARAHQALASAAGGQRLGRRRGRRRPRRRGGRCCARPPSRRARRRAGAARPGRSRPAARTAAARRRSRWRGRWRRASCRPGRRRWRPGPAPSTPSRSSSVRSRAWSGDAARARRVAGSAIARVRSARTSAGARSTVPSAWPPSAGSSTRAVADPAASTATAGRPRARRGRRVSPIVSGAVAGGAPTRRRRSAARVGPRNGASATPQRQLLGDDRHLDGRGPRRAVVGGRCAARASPAASTAASSLAPPLVVVEAGDGARARAGRRAARPSRGSARCSGERRTSIRRRLRRAAAPTSSRSVRRSTLPGRQAGDGVDDDDVAHLLVGGERVGHELLELGGVDGLVRVELHGGHRHLAGLLVGDPEHRAVDDGGVAVEHRLDLGGGHLEALHLDHLLGAVGEVHPALRLEPADVAGAVPAVDEGLVVGLLGQVALHERRAPGLDLARRRPARAPRRCRGRRRGAPPRDPAGRPSRGATRRGGRRGCTRSPAARWRRRPGATARPSAR